jgi:hypothetical protein
LARRAHAQQLDGEVGIGLGVAVEHAAGEHVVAVVPAITPLPCRR